MVSVLAYHSYDPSSNPADSNSEFFSVHCMKISEINEKRPGIAHFLIKYFN